MDTEKRIEQLEKKVDSIHSMVKGLYRSDQNSKTMSWIKWTIIIVLFFVGISYIKPYITQVMNMYSSVVDIGNSVSEVKEGYSDLFKNLIP